MLCPTTDERTRAASRAFVRAVGAGGAAVGPNERVGANVDPSHRYWQGISVTDAIRYLGERDAIHHFHAEDNEDSLTSSREGLEKAIDLLERAVFREQPGGADRAE